MCKVIRPKKRVPSENLIPEALKRTGATAIAVLLSHCKTLQLPCQPQHGIIVLPAMPISSPLSLP